MRLVLASEADLAGVNALAADCVAAMRAVWIDQWDEIYPAAADFGRDCAAGSLLLMRDDAGELVGCATLDGNQSPQYADVAWALAGERVGVVHRLMISPGHAGKGLAKMLMRLMEEEAVRRSFDVMRLDAFPQNPAAMRLYEGLRYRRAGECPFRKGTFVCFEKRLGATDFTS